MNPLSRNLRRLSTTNISSSIRYTGIAGTYKDLASWIEHHPHLFKTKTAFLWLGNTMANMSPSEATITITMLANALPTCVRHLTTFILGLDACHDQARISQAYTSTKTREWAMNALNHANQLIGYTILSPDDWCLQDEYHKETSCFRLGFRAQRDLELWLDDGKILFKAGDLLPLAQSRKWSSIDLDGILRFSNFKVFERWSDETKFYSKTSVESLSEIRGIYKLTSIRLFCNQL